MSVLEPLGKHLSKILRVHMAHNGCIRVPEPSAVAEVGAVGQVNILAAQQGLIEHVELREQPRSHQEIRSDAVWRPGAQRPLLVPQPLRASLDRSRGPVREDGTADEIRPRIAGGVGHELA
jgi:hypothetical protein